MRRLFLVTERRGGPWDWSKELRDQTGLEAHSVLVDELVEAGLIVLGGPLDERDVLLAIRAESESDVTARLADDPWLIGGTLTISEVRPGRSFSHAKPTEPLPLRRQRALSAPAI